MSPVFFEPSDSRCDTHIAGAVQDDEPTCFDCGEPHWYNFWVPDRVWALICPIQPFAPDQQGGVLCARCIDRRCVEAGIRGVVGRFYFTGEAVRARDDDLGSGATHVPGYRWVPLRQGER